MRRPFIQSRRTQRRRPLRADRRQKGFTLLETLIALAISAVMMTAVFGMLDGVMRWYGKAVTAHRLEQLQDDIGRAYAENMLSVESKTTATDASGLVFPNGTVGTVNGTSCNAGAAAPFAAVSTYLESSPGQVRLDGFQRPFCVYFTPQMSFAVGGTTLYYHSIAIVSMGASGALNTSWDSAGTLTLGGDNLGVVIDGRGIALRQFQSVQSQMQKIVQATQSYFQGRFQASGGSTSVDYFGTNSGDTSWDSAGTMPITSGSSMVADSTFEQALGLSVLDLTDPFSQPYYFDNSSSAVRSPSNTSASMNGAPPWTARISTSLPGGITYYQTAIGSY